jgi:hypothetical protein
LVAIATLRLSGAVVNRRARSKTERSWQPHDRRQVQQRAGGAGAPNDDRAVVRRTPPDDRGRYFGGWGIAEE